MTAAVLLAAAVAGPAPAMQRRHRLAASARISTVHAQGRSLVNDLLVLRVLPNGMAHSRFCFIAGKRVGNAVVRNRTKRRLRELVRVMPTAPGWDTILIARRGAGAADFNRLDRAVRNLWRRSNIATANPAQPNPAIANPSMVNPPHHLADATRTAQHTPESTP